MANNIDKQLTVGEVAQARILAKEALKAGTLEPSGNKDVDLLAKKYVAEKQRLDVKLDNIKAERQENRNTWGAFRVFPDYLMGDAREQLHSAAEIIRFGKILDGHAPLGKDPIVEEVLSEFKQKAVLQDVQNPDQSKSSPTAGTKQDAGLVK